MYFRAEDPGFRLHSGFLYVCLLPGFAATPVQVSLFLQFVFEARVCLNGKDLRIWTAARAELQAIYLAATDFMRSSVDSASGDDKKICALELAKSLCNTFLNVPVQSMVFDDDEGQSVRRIATTMSTRQAEVVQPLRRFLATQMKLPLVMHDIVRDTLAALLAIEGLLRTVNQSLKRRRPRIQIR